MNDPAVRMCWVFASLSCLLVLSPVAPHIEFSLVCLAVVGFLLALTLFPYLLIRLLLHALKQSAVRRRFLACGVSGSVVLLFDLSLVIFHFDSSGPAPSATFLLLLPLFGSLLAIAGFGLGWLCTRRSPDV